MKNVLFLPLNGLAYGFTARFSGGVKRANDKVRNKRAFGKHPAFALCRIFTQLKKVVDGFHFCIDHGLLDPLSRRLKQVVVIRLLIMKIVKQQPFRDTRLRGNFIRRGMAVIAAGKHLETRVDDSLPFFLRQRKKRLIHNSSPA